jgi:hypothetical protein
MDRVKQSGMIGEVDCLSEPCSRMAYRICGSGRQIVRILQKNPGKEPQKYDEDDIAHMRKVVAVSRLISFYVWPEC